MLHHLDDIKLYLDTFQNILNGIAILDRTFLDMELLKPIFCAAALVGIHIASPFLSLMLDTRTTYDTIIKAFPTVYQDLATMNVGHTLQTNRKVITFIDNDKFEDTLPNIDLQKSVCDCALEYQNEVTQLLQIIIPFLAEGFSEQHGAIFGFGPKSDEETGTILKIKYADEEKRRKLAKAPIHNLNEERSVTRIH